MSITGSFGSGPYGSGLYGGGSGVALNSLLSICQLVAGRVPIAIPTQIIGNPDTDAQQLLAAAQEEGDELARYPSFGWVTMQRENDFSTIALAPQSGTIANTGSGGLAQVTGLATTAGVTAGSWYCFGNDLKINSIVLSVDGPTQITLNLPAALPAGVTSQAGTFTLGQSDYPVPSDLERPIDNTMWDRSRFWSMRGPLSPQQWQLYKSSVIGRASIQRRFRFRYVNGQGVISIDPVPTDNGSQLVYEYVSNAWCMSTSNVRQQSWQADTDVPLLDPFLMRLGILYRFLRRLGMSYDDEMDRYERQRSKAASQDGGAAILDLAPPDRLQLLGPWNLPETNYGNVSGS